MKWSLEDLIERFFLFIGLIKDRKHSEEPEAPIIVVKEAGVKEIPKPIEDSNEIILNGIYKNKITSTLIQIKKINGKIAYWNWYPNIGSSLHAIEIDSFLQDYKFIQDGE